MTLQKVCLYFIFLVLSVLLVGCQQVNNSENTEEKIDIHNPKIPYSPEEARKNGDVVSVFGQISNLESLDNFVENIEIETMETIDAILIAKYTIEGDPIFYNLQYDGKFIHYAYEPSQDRFGDFGVEIKTTTCSNLVSENREDGVEYYLEGCDSEIGDTFQFLIVQE